MRSFIVLVVSASPFFSLGCSCAGPAPTAPDTGAPDTGAPDGGAFDAPVIGDAASDATPDVRADAPSIDTGVADASTARCDHPVQWTADPAAETAARIALAEFLPATTPTWDARRGTLSSIAGMNLALSCPDGADLWDGLRALLTDHPTIFQIDLEEWGTPLPYPCTAVGTGIEFVRLDRKELGGEEVAHDFLTFVVQRDATGVVVRSFNGFYLPVAPDEIVGAMATCARLDPAVARAAALAETYPYTTFDRCVIDGEGVYTPNAADVLELEPLRRWTWNERADGLGVELMAEQLAVLVIAPANVTPALERSDVNCPNDAGDARVYGYRLTFDAVSGAVLSKQPGVGCIVC